MTGRNEHPGPHALRLAVRDEPSAVAEVRAAVERVGAAVGLPPDPLFNLKLAATEAVANALRHPSNDGAGVEVTLAAHDDALEVEVENAGTFRPGDALDPERGRGLPLMLALTDEVQFAASPAGMRVRLRMRLEPGREAA
jgi:anti-sigma regulatory factor (Ser/Thr protein kinase)